MENIKLIKSELDRHTNFKRQANASRYFKSGPGEYAEGDQFLGVANPDLRAISKLFWNEVSEDEVAELLNDPIHEVRLLGIFILVLKFQKAKTPTNKEVWVNVYLNNLEKINNWDLVDSSCYQILGAFYWKREKNLFFNLATSPSLWRQRVAMISSFYWIRKREFSDALALAAQLKSHPHDLMHKAVGWMIREIGKRDFEVANEFLKKHYSSLPRTALRYAIERFPEELMQDYLKGRI